MILTGGWVSCCALARSHTVCSKQDSCCVAVIATYPCDYCQWMLLGVFWLGLHRRQGSLYRLHGNMQSTLASKLPSEIQGLPYCFTVVGIIWHRCWVCHKGSRKHIRDGKASMSLHPKTKLFEVCGTVTRGHHLIFFFSCNTITFFFLVFQCLLMNKYRITGLNHNFFFV